MNWPCFSLIRLLFFLLRIATNITVIERWFLPFLPGAP
jgi:hypothetical protein